MKNFRRSGGPVPLPYIVPASRRGERSRSWSVDRGRFGRCTASPEPGLRELYATALYKCYTHERPAGIHDFPYPTDSARLSAKEITNRAIATAILVLPPNLSPSTLRPGIHEAHRVSPSRVDSAARCSGRLCRFLAIERDPLRRGDSARARRAQGRWRKGHRHAE
jgi:hypothetical protein